MVKWQVETDPDKYGCRKWVEYPQNTQSALEEMYLDPDTGRENFCDYTWTNPKTKTPWTYEVYPKRMVQINVDTGKKRTIQRCFITPSQTPSGTQDIMYAIKDVGSDWDKCN